MARTFNPPPDRPSAPQGWAPPPGWEPDASWPPVPDGWDLWVEGERPAPRRRLLPLALAAVGGLVLGIVIGSGVTGAGLSDERDVLAADQERLTDATAAVEAREDEVTEREDDATTAAEDAAADQAAADAAGQQNDARADELSALAATLDQRSADLDATAAGLAAREADVAAREAAAASRTGSSSSSSGTTSGGSSGGSTYYANCDAARAAGAAPVHVGDPGYRAGLDRDGDGVGCE